MSLNIGVVCLEVGALAIAAIAVSFLDTNSANVVPLGGVDSSWLP